MEKRMLAVVGIAWLEGWLICVEPCPASQTEANILTDIIYSKKDANIKKQRKLTYKITITLLFSIIKRVEGQTIKEVT